MARTVKNKKLINTRLATNYGGWVYCDQCNENIGYLCYSTYDKIEFNYECNCGSHGSAVLDFEDSQAGEACADDMVAIKNRLCCAKDQKPLLTILDSKLAHYDLKVTCKACNRIYSKTK